MSAPTTTGAPPAVLAVLVTHDGRSWLPRTLASLEAQTHPDVRIVAVDNASSDGSRELLLDRLGHERVLVADRDLGFGGAVSMALDARRPSTAPYVLLVHDDLELAPDAVAQLVEALETDPRLAIVGPKLLQWDAPEQLQAVGSTIDITGRVDSGVDEGELDQGQRDQERRALYVSTAGMLVRREVLDHLGRFDARYHVFRDDLDLCWRTWLAGHDVEVVPEATAQHAAGAANYLRLGQTRFLGPRYFAERNTLATLLKNYGALRLLLVLPLFLVVGVAKTVGFLLTRRFSDAWQTVRAWLWNLAHLRETRRYRRQVQAQRTRSDAEVAELFGRLGPRIRAYAEAMASWIAGGDADPAPEPAHRDAPPPEPATATSRLRALLRRRPTLVAGLGLVLLALAGTWPLLRPGELRGGQLAPWPAAPGAFLGDHVAGWSTAGTFGTSLDPSPAQALLGLLQLLLGGSSYLAPRALLLLPFVLAWLFALRAVQPFSARRGPRVVAATAYVLSPPAIAALLTARIEALVVLAALPGLVAAFGTVARRDVPPARAWRAVAGAVLLGAVVGAFEPAVLLVVLVVSAAMAVVLAVRTDDLIWRTRVLARAAVAGLGPVLLLAPWSFQLLEPDGPLLGRPEATELAGGHLALWLLLAPGLDGFPGLVAGVGFLLAGLLGLALGWRRAQPVVLGLWVAAVVGAVAGWALDRGSQGIWAGTPLLVTAAAFAGAFAVAFATGARQLARHTFGWRQLAAVATALAVVVSLGSVAWALVRDPIDTLAVGEPTLPSFVVAEAESQGPFRVAVLTVEDGAAVYEVVDGEGPSMAAYGVPQPAAAEQAVAAALGDVLGVRDPRAADRLGRLGVRYLLVPEGAGTPELSEALLAQERLEPRPVASGELHEVVGWLPRVAVVDAAAARALDERGTLPSDAEVVALELGADGRATGTLPVPGSLLLTEVEDPGWTVTVDGAQADAPVGTPSRADGLPAGEVELTHDRRSARLAAVTWQVVLLLGVVSLALRPPGVARRPRRAPDNEVVG
ncbi:MAG: glycosyltransferase [Nitriliruptoraceae bacterium]